MPPLKIDFFVIGAQKCATSWMFNCLAPHPEINIPHKKMEIGYIGGPVFKERGESWFFMRFPVQHGNAVKGDVSVDYMLDPNSAVNIRPYVRNPKFIAVLREPVDRMISAYYWSLRKRQLPIRPIESAFQGYLTHDAEMSGRFDDRVKDELFRRGFYAQQLRPFIDAYGTQSMLVFLYEEICRDPVDVIHRIFTFLGVDTEFSPSKMNERPKVNSYNTLLLRLQNMTKSKALSKVFDYANRIFVSKFGRTDPLTLRTREQLNKLFLPHIEQTELLLSELPEGQRPADFRLTRLWSTFPGGF